MARLWQALRTPGTLILEVIDFTGAFCHPPNAAFTRYCELYVRVIARRGGDANVGPKLYGLCRAAGLGDVSVQVVQPAHCGSSEEKDLSLGTLVNIADAVLAERATAEEVRDTIEGLAAFTQDTGSIVACPRIFQVRGHKRASHPVT